MNFCILGSGAWGTAVAIHLNRRGHTVTLVSRRIESAMEIASTRENKEHLPGFKLPHSLQIGHEAGPAIMEADVIIVACPSKHLRATAESLKPHLAGAHSLRLVVSLCKGLEGGSLLRGSQVLAEVLPGIPHGILSGPTNAGEVAMGLPSAVVFAVDKEDAFTKEVQEAFSDKHLRAYRSQDVIGVELGGVLKNIYAVGAGICDGLNLGSNSKAAFVTRAIREMVSLGVAEGGKAETFMGLSGVGDLIATAHGGWSRNRGFGAKLAQDAGTAIAEAESGAVTVEGYRATDNFRRLASRHGIHAPILEGLHAVLFGGVPPARGIEILMTRELKSE